MQKIKIITDSSADMPKELFEELDIEKIPLLINFGEESYYDGVDIDLETLFEKTNNGSIFPNTSQITPTRFQEVYKKYLDQGYKIISIHLSSRMSGTYQSACLAKNALESDDIHVIDSQNVTAGLALLSYRAAKLREAGKSVEEIIDDIEYNKNKVYSSLCFESLNNLVKGGRISRTVGAVTGMLGIKLILEVKKGVMEIKDKVRGNKKTVKKIIKDIETEGIMENMPVILINVNSDEIYFQIKDYLNEKNIDTIDTNVGCTVGIHSGNHATGVFFFGGKK